MIVSRRAIERGPAPLVPRAGPAQHGRVNILLVALFATGVGFLLMLLAGRGRRPEGGAGQSEGEADDLSWVRGHGTDGLHRLLAALLREMGFEVERREPGGGSADFHAVDPTPIRGGRVYVHGVVARPGVPVDAAEVRALAEAVRAEALGKALFVTLGRFTDEARQAAQGCPLELIDGTALAALVKKHLPQVHATRTL